MPSKRSKSEIVQQIQSLILELDYVQEFQALEKEIFEDNALLESYKKMKELQKEATLFKKMGKVNAFKETSQKARRIEDKLKENPKVGEYFQKMQDVSDLLQYLTHEIEERFNERLLEE